MTSIGIWSCQHRELQPINLGKRRGSVRLGGVSSEAISTNNKGRKQNAVFDNNGSNVEFEMDGLEESRAQV